MQEVVAARGQKNRLLKRPEVLQRVPISSSTLYEMVASGEFPKPIKIGKQAVAWRESDVEQWIQSRIDQRDGLQPSAEPISLTCTVTGRGFPFISFEDQYGETCSLQISSLMGPQTYCWLGVAAPSIKVLEEGKGWQSVKLPDGAVIGSRMHLSQDQVRALLPHLQAFAESGEFAFDPLSA